MPEDKRLLCFNFLCLPILHDVSIIDSWLSESWLIDDHVVCLACWSLQYLFKYISRLKSRPLLASVTNCNGWDDFASGAGFIFSKVEYLSSIYESESRSVMSDSLRPHGLCSPWNSPGQNTGVCSLSLLQGIFPTQGSNSGLLHCRQVPHQLSQQGSPLVCTVWPKFGFSAGQIMAPWTFCLWTIWKPGLWFLSEWFPFITAVDWFPWA